jgi:mannosyltransferase
MYAQYVDDFQVVLQKSRLQYMLLLLITTIAVILRFYKLGYWSFWIDEIYTIRSSLATVNGSSWPQISLMLTGIVLSTQGVSEWSSRIVSAIIGVITIPALYFPIKRLFGPFVALIAVLLLAVSPWHLYWSQNARFYTTLLLFYTLATLFLYIGVENKKPGYLLLSAILLLLAVIERYFALFLVPVVMVYGIVRTWIQFRRSGSISFAPFFRLAFVIVVPFIVLILLDPEAFSRLIQTFFGHSNHSPLRLLLSIIYRIGIPLISLALVGIFYILLRYRNAGLFITLGAIVPIVLLVAISPFAFTVDRYVFATLPNWTIIGAVTIKELFDQTKGHAKLLAYGVLLVLLTDSISQDMLYYTHQNGNRPDWRGAVTMIAQHKSDGEIIATTRPELVNYYLGDEDKDVVYIYQLDPHKIEELNTRLWIIEDQDWGDSSLQEWVRENCTLVDVRDVYIPGKNLILRVYLYDPLAHR